MKKAAILMGSDSDLPVMRKAFELLRQFGVETEMHALSAHRCPERVRAFASTAAAGGFGVIIAGAGKAAHLAGAVASQTALPVIGVPLSASQFDGLDALLSTVQMPTGVPVATVAVNGAENAALLACQILAVGDELLADRLTAYRGAMTARAEQNDLALQAALRKEE